MRDSIGAINEDVGAARSGLIKILITDENTAREMLSILNG